MNCTLILRNTLWSSYLSVKNTTCGKHEYNENRSSVKEKYSNDRGDSNQYNCRQTSSSPTLVVTLYDRLVRKNVIKRDLEQRVMAEACTPLLQLIRRTIDEESRTNKHNKFRIRFSSLRSKLAHSNMNENTKMKNEVHENTLNDTSDVEENSLTCNEHFCRGYDDAHQRAHCKRKTHLQATNWFSWSSLSSFSPYTTPSMKVVFPESVNFDSIDYDKHGLYLWGKVGIGKTMILDLFDLCELPCTKRRVHLHAFMNELCDRLVSAERELNRQEGESCNLQKQEKNLKTYTLEVTKGRCDDTNNNDVDECFFTSSRNDRNQNLSSNRSKTFIYACIHSLTESIKIYQFKLVPFFSSQRWHKMWNKLQRYVNVHNNRNTKSTPQWRRPMDKVVDDIVRESRVLCFDEFQTFDVAYAALLASFFTSAFAKGLFMVATSNRPPEELCCTSTSFSQFVPLLRTYCRVLECTSHRECDYRYAQATPTLCFHEQIFLYPATLQNERKLVEMVERCMRDNEQQPHVNITKEVHNENSTTNNLIRNDNDNTSDSVINSSDFKEEEERYMERVKYDECTNMEKNNNVVSGQINNSSHHFVHDKPKCWVENVELIHHGRRCVVPRSCNGVAVFDYSDICTSVRQQLCSIDYQLVAANYHTIILLNVPQVGTLDYNSLHQFIIFIDELYQRNVKLLMTAKIPWRHLMDSDASWKDYYSSDGERCNNTLNEMCNDERLLEECEQKSNETQCNGFMKGSCSEDDSAENTYYSEGEDDRSSVFANEMKFRNEEELMSIARIRSRLVEMGCVNYLLRDHVNFVTHDYTFANLLNTHLINT